MKKLVVISGAGVSAESGISTFRDGNGLWNNYKIEDVATPQAWAKNPALVQEFYNQRRKNVIAAQPNAAHLAITELQQHYDVHVVTQNVDDLHERAGTDKVLHLHGNIRFAKSSNPDRVLDAEFDVQEEYYLIDGDTLNYPDDKAPDGYPLRPHIVWFYEPVVLIDAAADIVAEADVVIVVGTSLEVYPAASLVYRIKKGAHVFCIDPNAESLMIEQSVTLIKDVATSGFARIKDDLIRLAN